MGIPESLGKSEGLAAIAVATIVSLVGLLIFQRLDMPNFITGLGLVLGSLFGGGAVAAFRK